jgi:hypothetical protein
MDIRARPFVEQAFAGQLTRAMQVREVEILLQLTVFRDLPPQ